MIRFVIGAGGKDPFLPHNFRAMDQRLVAPADGVVVDKRQVHYIQLVFNASGIMGVPTWIPGSPNEESFVFSQKLLISLTFYLLNLAVILVMCYTIHN